MACVFQPLTIEDVPMVVELFKKLKKEGAEVSFTDAITREDVEKWMENPSFYVYLAMEEKSVVGVFRGKKGEGNRDYSATLTIAIDPHYRGKKIAQELALYGLDQLRKENIRLARAYIFSNNKPSINTALSCGFTLSGSVFRDHYNETTGEYVDDLIFHKLL